MAEIRINRQVETITVPDGRGGTATEWRVATDDASVAKMIAKIGDAVDRAHVLVRMAEEADTEAAADEAKGALARLQRRVIEAVIGPQGYADVLAYIGDGEPADPVSNISNVGEVMAALLMWAHSRCASPMLAQAGEAMAEALKRKKGKKAKRK